MCMDKIKMDEMEFIKAALDAVKTAISIYDKDANVVYANRQFFADLYLGDRDQALGRNINELLQEGGVEVASLDDPGKRMKMMEVISTGREATDWEVRITSKANPNMTRITSNDMYPVKDAGGRVIGMIELNRSRQQDMSKARRFHGLSAEITFDSIIGTSAAIRDTVRSAKRYADNPFNLLITGESGVGKEMFAQAVHNYSSRRSGPFVALNCSSFPENLIESELFGYVGGAFTGASRKGQMGKFELADKGTLFLDEIGEMPYHFQAKILRVLETWNITRIGGTHPVPVNVRLIAATNRNLEEMVEKGLFREDLYYRLAGLHVLVPPLRERRDDIPLMAEHFLRSAPGYREEQAMRFDTGAKTILKSYDWPGNVRELKNIINRASVLAAGPVITADVMQKALFGDEWSGAESDSVSDAPGVGAGGVSSTETETMEMQGAADVSAEGIDEEKWSALPPEERLARRSQAVDQAHADYVKEALEIAGGKVTLAAELLDVSRKTMYRFMEKYEIDSNVFRKGRS